MFMKYISFMIVSFLCCCSESSVEHSDIKKFVYDTNLRQRFTVDYHLDSMQIEECVYNIKFRKSVHFYFENMIGKIDSDPSGMVIKTPDFWFGVCNLPAELKFYNDSILISGRVFYSLGDERMRGYPTVLSEIRTAKK